MIYKLFDLEDNGRGVRHESVPSLLFTVRTRGNTTHDRSVLVAIQLTIAQCSWQYNSLSARGNTTRSVLTQLSK